MPSTAAIAGGVAAVLICAGVGIGLGVGLTRDDNDSPPPAEPEDALSQEAGGVGTAAVGPAAIGAPLAAGPRGPPGMFPGTAPAAIIPLPEPTLATPPPRPDLAPLFGPDLAPIDEFPMDAPGAGPMEMPAEFPDELPAETPGPFPMPAEIPELEPSPSPIDPEIVPVEPPAPAPEPVPSPEPAPVGSFSDKIVPGPDGKYTVCVNGDSEQWGLWNIFRPCGVRVFADGRVELAEWFGGFDGYPAVDPADGHETCFNSAVAEMFDVPLCDFERTTEGVDEETGEDIEAIICEENEDGSQCVCAADDKAASLKSQRGWEGNKGIITFLTTLRERSNPTNYDFPQDEEIADAGGRADNVKLVQDEFEKMITVQQC
eukprot:jgi/Ulvmu1/5527/UM023_0063.1